MYSVHSKPSKLLTTISHW